MHISKYLLKCTVIHLTHMFRTEPIIWPPHLFSCIPVLMNTSCLSQKFWNAQPLFHLLSTPLPIILQVLHILLPRYSWNLSHSLRSYWQYLIIWFSPLNDLQLNSLKTVLPFPIYLLLKLSSNCGPQSGDSLQTLCLLPTRRWGACTRRSLKHTA